ncbi:MAG TPA: AraC family transcriptional regulator [Stellaceae bacterium]|nr:AraC family transcriptional regulator [Stellaceae bacterium]
MNTDVTNRSVPRRDHSPSAPPTLRTIADGRGWCITEYVCHAGPGDRAVEERHGSFSIAAVMEGLFRYRGETGTALLHPGAFLLGNFGAPFECGHDHNHGDRCLAFHVDSDYFAEMAAFAGGSAELRFKTAMLGASPATLPWVARTHVLLEQADALALGEATMELFALTIAVLSGHVSAPQRISANDERRISRALHLSEQAFSDPLTLDQLAAAASMSKYHFLRSFRRIVGMTPYRYLLGLRLRHAAVRLAQSSAPVSAIAFDTGFGDLSTFNARFRRHFGASPSRYRAQLRRA